MDDLQFHFFQTALKLRLVGQFAMSTYLYWGKIAESITSAHPFRSPQIFSDGIKQH